MLMWRELGGWWGIVSVAVVGSAESDRGGRGCRGLFRPCFRAVPESVWAAEKPEEGPWRRVRVLDAGDMVAWLEEAPAVHTWLSIQAGKIPPGTNDLEAYRDGWPGATRPALAHATMLSGRGKAVAKMHRRLAE